MLMNVQETRIPNGIRVITSTMPHVQSVSIGVWVGVGSRYESAPMAGATHFIEHMLFKGTRKRTIQDISREIEGRGGYLNAFTQEEATCYYARVACDQLENAMDVLTDMYRNPLLDAAEIKRESRVVIEEIMMYRDQPQHVVQELLGRALWSRHQLGRPVIGEPKTLSRMDRRELLQYKQRHYVPGCTVIAAAGRLEHDECLKWTRRMLGRCRPQRRPACRRVTASVGQERMVISRKDIEQNHLALGFRIFGRRDKRRYALKILNAVLGENMSSRLFQVVREKHGLAYAIHSYPQLFADSGALIVSAGLDRTRHVQALRLILRELRRMATTPVGARELQRAREYALGHLRMGLESTSSQMTWIGGGLLAHDRVEPPEDVMHHLSSVTAADVQRLAGQILKTKRCSLALVGSDFSERDRERMRELLGDL